MTDARGPVGRRKLLWLLLAIAVLGWGLALSGRRHLAPDAPAGSPPSPAASRPPAELDPPEPSRASPEPPKPAEAPSPPPGAEQAPTEPQAPERSREELMALARERQRLNDARWETATAAWESQRRDARWAPAQEKALVEAMEESGADRLLVHVECRHTLCRLELHVPDSHTFFSLGESESFIRVMGRDTTAKTTGAPAERLLVLFAAREGYPLEPALSEP